MIINDNEGIGAVLKAIKEYVYEHIDEIDFTSVLNAIAESEQAVKQVMPSIPTDYARQGAVAKNLDDIKVEIPNDVARGA